MHLVRLGITQAKQVLLGGRWAEWILNTSPLLQRLGCPPQAVHQLLDFYHATEHLQQFADAAYPTLRRTSLVPSPAVTLRVGRFDLLERMQV